MKLVSMIDFVLEHEDNPDNLEVTELGMSLYSINQYATFLNQPLNLGMFVPAIEVDGKWEVIYEPRRNYWDIDMFIVKSAKDIYDEKLKKFQQAKDKVLFEGFDLVKTNRDLEILIVNYDNETINDLIKYAPTLTAKGQELRGLNK